MSNILINQIIVSRLKSDSRGDTENDYTFKFYFKSYLINGILEENKYIKCQYKR